MIELLEATADDAEELVSLHTAVAEDLTARHGKGHWSSATTVKGVLFTMKRATVFVARKRQRIVATLALSTRKPWAIDKSYFAPSARPLYLTSMAVDPSHQRQGLGTQCMEKAREITAGWPADAIRLDAYDAAGGAGGFYARCGFTEVGRVVYRTVPLIYYEWLVPQR
jgi:GNAT superfamily N-acetyltransferase